ncbi:MAG TPA: sulfite exporter TauE/SafE family protein [Pseudolabrys sp.]|nr:sulfite exporter TauE/SafE family protein [Pseudolabrys sp.]
MIGDYVVLGLIGFAAQLVDGALGMAFGVISTSAMLAMGLPPAHASAVVHTAEIFTTGASAASHIWHRNVDWRLVIRLGVAGVIGAVLGAWLLSNVDSTAARPLIGLYLLAMGIFILLKAWRLSPARDTPAKWVPSVGFVAGFLDASGGGGWGPVATSTLIGSGHAPRTAVGSVNTTEFFVTTAAATTFFIELGVAPVQELLALVIGGVLAAPLGGWMVKRIPARVLMLGVGVLVVGLSAWQLARWLHLV